MKIRLVHNQSTKGPIILTDIDQGLPIEHLDEERKQSCYLSYYHKYFVKEPNGVVRVEVDRTRPGFIDLVPSDKVTQPMATGQLKGLADQGLLEVVSIPDGGFVAPEIEEATYEEGTLTITGTGFLSAAPDVTGVKVTEEADSVEQDLPTPTTLTDAEIIFDGLDLDEGEYLVVVTANGKESNEETFPAGGLIEGDSGNSEQGAGGGGQP